MGKQELVIHSDMIPAEMPPRELPADMTQEMQGFVTLVEGIYTCMNDPELFGNVIRNLMQELQSHPEYDKLLVDEDVGAMMKGLRSSMGMAVIKKQEKTPRKASAKAPKTAAMASALDNMDFGDGAWD